MSIQVTTKHIIRSIIGDTKCKYRKISKHKLALRERSLLNGIDDHIKRANVLHEIYQDNKPIALLEINFTEEYGVIEFNYGLHLGKPERAFLSLANLGVKFENSFDKLPHLNKKLELMIK